jgi:hypothetical protein
MRLPLWLSASCWNGLAIALLATSAALGAEPKNAHSVRANPDDQRARTLVEEALAAESAGDTEARDAKLKQAIELAPKLPSAHWAAGQVQLHGHWVSLSEAEKRASHDPTWQQYCELRDSKPSGAASEEELAVWCRKHKLTGQAGVHWRRVLTGDPENAEALKELNLHWFQDVLRTSAEIAELKRQEVQVSKATAHWQPKLVAWRRDVQSKHAPTAEKAREGIRTIDDPAVIPVFETLLTHNSPDNNDPAFSTEVTRSLGKLHGQAVNAVLVRLALRARWDETRREATRQLSTRELIDYAPYALSLLRSPIQHASRIFFGPDGNIYYYSRNRQNNIDAEDLRENLDETVLQVVGRAKPEEFEVDIEKRLKIKQVQQFWDSKMIAEQNAVWAGEVQNARDLFRANAQVDQGNDPQDWWDWWVDFNELQNSSDKPLRQSWQTCAMPGYIGGLSCFVAGTKVSTQTGLRPIEEIKPGDAVLAQDPQTGELAYQCVLATTIRPPSPLRKLTVDGEEISATRGHRFWRDGRGWQMAKFLTAGGLLHTVSGALPITAVEDAGEDQAYNLVVENFHTYFVGEHRILVHDNSAPKPVLGPVPGLSLAEQ